MAFHNLTTHDMRTMNIKALLGLGPKLSVQPKGTQWKDTNRMLHRFKRDVRLRNYLMMNVNIDDEDAPRLCRNNEKW